MKQRVKKEKVRIFHNLKDSPADGMAHERRKTLRHIALCALVLLFESATPSQTPRTLSVPADSPRWELEGEAKPAEYQGRKCLLLDGGAATLKDFDMRDGVVDVDVATPANRGFFGIQFRLNPGHAGLL